MSDLAYFEGGGLSETDESDVDDPRSEAELSDAEVLRSRLEGQGWTYMPSGSRGRHNFGIYKRDGRIAKVESLDPRDAPYSRAKQNLDAWVAIGKLDNLVQLFDYELVPVNGATYLVTMMEEAPGTEMSKVLIESETPLTGKDIAGWSRARYAACISIYRQSGFLQLDWKADNMFGMIDPETKQKIITFIDMQFDTVFPTPLPLEHNPDSNFRLRSSWVRLLSWNSDAYTGSGLGYESSLYTDRNYDIIQAAVWDCISHGGTPNDVFALLENPGFRYESSLQKALPLKNRRASLMQTRAQIKADYDAEMQAEKRRHEEVVAQLERTFRSTSIENSTATQKIDLNLKALGSWEFNGTDLANMYGYGKEHMHALIGKFQEVDWPSVSLVKKPATTKWISNSDYESSDDDTDRTFGAAFVDMCFRSK